MRPGRRLLTPALAALGLAGSLGLAAGPAAHADTTTPLPDLTSFRQMVVDSADGYLFLSEGGSSANFVNGVGADSSSAIVVTTLTGQHVTTLDAGDGVEGLALDGTTLYAALATPDEIAGIDIATITQTTPTQALYPMPAGDIPYGLAMQSGKLWVGYSGKAAGTGAVGDLDLSSGTFEPATSAEVGFYSAPDLAADPSDTGILVASDAVGLPPTIGVYQTTTDPVTALLSARALDGTPSCGVEQQIAVFPGGGKFLISCTNAAVAYSTANLTGSSSPVTTYSAPQYQVAGAVAGDGAVAIGTNAGSAASGVDVYGPDGTGRNLFSLTGSWEPAPGGLAWSPDGSHLYALLQSLGGSSYSLQVYTSPELSRPTLTLSGPASVESGAVLALTGKLAFFAGNAPAGTPIAISRGNPDGTTSKLASVQTDADGNFTVPDVARALGGYTYTASYAGSPTSATAQATATVTVTTGTPVITLTGPASTIPFRAFSLRGTLSLGSGTPVTGTPITVTRENPTGTTTRIAGITSGTGGSFTINDKLSALGSYTYTASVPATSTTTAATGTFKVTVAKGTPTLTLSPSAPTALYDSTVKVTAHLGSTYSNRTVSIYAQLVGSGVKKLLKAATVNSGGNLVVSYPAATRNVIFTTAFSGDAQYNARSVSVRVGVAVRVAMTNSGWYTTTKFIGVTFHVFHHTAHLNVAVTVTPNKRGETVDLVAQQWYGNKWNNVTGDLFTATLNSSSEISGYLTLGSVTGDYFRLIAVFVPSSKDVTNVSYHSAWFYFAVVK